MNLGDVGEQFDRFEEDGVDYALVGPEDNRIHELNTRQFPFNTVCHVERDFGNGRWTGCTGTLLSPNILLTAGHCLFSHLRGGPPKRLRVIPGRRDRDTFPFGFVYSRLFYVPKGFICPGRGRSKQRRWYDYGIAVLLRPFRNITQFMGFVPMSYNQLKKLSKNQKITIAGYPGDRPTGSLWRHSERLEKITKRRLLYSVDTCPGHSGSPVWLWQRASASFHLIGVHTSGILDERGRSYGCRKGTVLAPGGLYNSGVRINTSVHKNILNPERRSRGNEQMIRIAV